MACCDGSKAFGYLPYDEGYGIFCGFMCREVEDKEFRDHLLNVEYGLCVYVITMLDNRYIIMQNDTVDTSKFLIELDKLQSKDMETFSRFNLNIESFNRVLQSMDTEYDISVLKAMIFSTASRKKVQEFLPVEETPVTNTNSNTMREVDDFHPRPCLKQAYRNKEISIEDCASIQTFCNKYIVEENLVKTYLENLNHLEMMSEKRKTEKKKRI